MFRLFPAQKFVANVPMFHNTTVCIILTKLGGEVVREFWEEHVSY